MALTAQQIAAAKTRLRKLEWASARIKREMNLLQRVLKVEEETVTLQEYLEAKADVQTVVDIDKLTDPTEPEVVEER